MKTEIPFHQSSQGEGRYAGALGAERTRNTEDMGPQTRSYPKVEEVVLEGADRRLHINAAAVVVRGRRIKGFGIRADVGAEVITTTQDQMKAIQEKIWG